MPRALVEVIRDDDSLYRRVFWRHLGSGDEVLPIAFTSNVVPDDKISVDLARLTTEEQTLSGGRKPAEEYALGLIVAAHPRSLGFEVIHRPSPTNVAHSQIEGENTMTKCYLLAEGVRIIRRPGAGQVRPKGLDD